MTEFMQADDVQRRKPVVARCCLNKNGGKYMLAEHGGNIFRLDNVTDFSANINPLGTPSEVMDAAVGALERCGVYPDPFCTGLINELSVCEGIDSKLIVCGNGAADLIYRIVHALKPESAELVMPTFSEYEAALNEVGCGVSKVFLSRENGFEVSEDAAERVGMGERTDMVILCSPNNPTGRLIGRKQLAVIAENCRRRGITLVFDESFMGFARGGTGLKEFMSEKTVILRSFTKLYAIPGLRLGCAFFGSDALAEAVRHTGQFWSVSSPAQAAGEAAVKLHGFAEKTAEYVANERQFLADALTKAGFEVFPSDANFLLFRAFCGFSDVMLKKGVLVRECGNFEGLGDEYFRIAVRTSQENRYFAEVLKFVK